MNEGCRVFDNTGVSRADTPPPQCADALRPQDCADAVACIRIETCA